MGGDALDTEDGAALATEIVDMLESELVRFRHRLAHNHGIELDRARAALSLLGKLVGSGVTWTAKPDSDPTLIYEAFSSLIPQHPHLKKEVAAFFVATTDVKTVDDGLVTPSTILRHAGAEPPLWWWAAEFSDRAACWAACADDVDRTVQVALAFGVPIQPVARALAKAFALLATRLKTHYTPQRSVLLASLNTFDTAAITKLAFEMRFKDPQAKDPLAELSIHSFQLIEAAQAKDKPDVERFGVLARNANRMFTSRGLNLVAMVRGDLQEVIKPCVT
jgi:hypothetical protein